MIFRAAHRITCIACVISTVVLAGCSYEAMQAKQALEATLTDPSSVQYQNVVTYNGGVVCGQYNAKNAMGGYVGFKPFITLNGRLTQGDARANDTFLCRNSDHKRVEIGAFDLEPLTVDVVSIPSGKSLSWIIQTELLVEDGRKRELWGKRRELSAAVKKFLASKDGELSARKDKYTDNRRDDAAKKLLQAELQKLLPSLEIKGVNLLLS